MIIIDMIKINGKSLHSFGDTLIPCRIIDGAIKVIHSCWVRFGFGLLTETTWLDQQYQSFDLEGDAAVKWGAWGNTLVTGTFLYRGDNTPGRAGLNTEELKTGLIFQRFLSDRFNILFRGERVTQRHFFDNEEKRL